MNLFSKLGFFGLLGTIACNDGVKQGSSNSDVSAFTIDKIKLTKLDAQPVDLSKYKGKTIFINFWATWCKPCLQEMPSLQRMMEKQIGEDIVFLFASDETAEQITGFKNQHSYPFQYVQTENFSELEIMGLPTTFIFNGEGKLSFSEMGAREWDNSESVELITKITKQ